MSNDGRTWTLAALAALTAAGVVLKKGPDQGSTAKRPSGARLSSSDSLLSTSRGSRAEEEDPEAFLQITKPRAVAGERKVKLTITEKRDAKELAERAQLAYGWITEHAVYCPVGDMEFGKRPNQPLRFAGAEQQVWLVEGGESYCSFVLLPLLNLFAQRRALLVGGPGRSKTTIAFILGAIAGMSAKEMKKYVVRGHPQLTVADMIGSPLPAGMMTAKTLKQVPVAWRDWITARVKIIDEYNRIPTKTQSALLSLMAEGYTEQFDQMVTTKGGAESGKHGGSWFLTANDDKGGGTFEVIQALKDRIDIVVRAVSFHSGFVDDLLDRIERGEKPEDFVPENIQFTTTELDLVSDYIDEVVRLPKDVADKLGFFMGQLDFCRKASSNLENMNKDTLHLHGFTVADVCTNDCPLVKSQHLCTQTETGLSARTFETVLRFSKTLAWFRGRDQVSWEDVAQILPWATRDKLPMNERSQFFDAEGNAKFKKDKNAWIQNMIRMADERWKDEKSLREEVHRFTAEARKAQTDKKLGEDQIRSRAKKVYDRLAELVGTAELSGWIYEDVLDLKRAYQMYQNLLRRRRSK